MAGEVRFRRTFVGYKYHRTTVGLVRLPRRCTGYANPSERPTTVVFRLLLLAHGLGGRELCRHHGKKSRAENRHTTRSGRSRSVQK